jgi:hypothetical protein
MQYAPCSRFDSRQSYASTLMILFAWLLWQAADMIVLLVLG